MDALYLMAVGGSQSARQNWIANNYNLSAISSPTFTVDRGFTGNGSTSYLDTGADRVALSEFTRDSASLGLWSMTSGVIDTQLLAIQFKTAPG